LPCVPHSHLFLFTATATTLFSTLSLHDALPIYRCCLFPRRPPVARVRAGALGGDGLEPERLSRGQAHCPSAVRGRRARLARTAEDRKSTRLNSSHVAISYAVFCLKKKKYTRVHT